MLPVQGATGMIPGQGPKIPQAAQHGQKKKERETEISYRTQASPVNIPWKDVSKFV